MGSMGFGAPIDPSRNIQKLGATGHLEVPALKNRNAELMIWETGS
jgi:hypothetical protein